MTTTTMTTTRERNDQWGRDGQHADGRIAGQRGGRGDQEGAQNRSGLKKIVVILSER